MYGDSYITSKWCFDNLALKIYLCEHKFYIFPCLNLLLFKIFQFFPQFQRITFWESVYLFTLRIKSPCSDHLVFILFGRPFCIERFALCYQSVICLSACLSYSVWLSLVHWPGDWMDWNEIWHIGQPRPWPHCIYTGTRFPLPYGLDTYFPRKMVGRIKIPLSRPRSLK